MNGLKTEEKELNKLKEIEMKQNITQQHMKDCEELKNISCGIGRQK